MKYELYQVDTNKANEIALKPYCLIDPKKIWVKNYIMIDSGEIEYTRIEKCLSILWDKYWDENIVDEDNNYKSIKTSDIVVLYYDGYTKVFYCNSMGWKEIDDEVFFRELEESKKINFLTKEKQLIKKLADIYNEFTQLYSQHPNELSDFTDGIHKCQYVLDI